MSVKNEILAADDDRVRYEDLQINGQSFKVGVKLLSVREFASISRELGDVGDEQAAERVSGLLIDPETGERMFQPDEILDLSMATLKTILAFVGRVNTGAFEQKNV
ncbi:MAG: hypothetical protein PHI35_07240 [Victivallaceae bacterium]|nr:hypothetical protein [Victivallaceae bacterium]